MAIFATMVFVWVAAAAYVLFNLSTPMRRSTWFGVLNLLALVILLGWRPAAATVVVAFVYWAGLGLVAKHREAAPDGVGQSRFAPLLLYGSVALLFVAHKLVLEADNDLIRWTLFGAISKAVHHRPAITVLKLFQLVAFSYVCLRLIDAVRAVLSGAQLLDPIALSGYLVPFFMTPSGPINEYEEHLRLDLESPQTPSLGRFVDSSYLIVCGYFLKFACAQSLGILIHGIHDPWPIGTIRDTAVFLVYVLLEFTGYSLIALGVGRLLGVPTPVNFNHPYLATSFADFWTRWHMSLGSFVRRTFYFPIRVALSRYLKPKRGDKFTIHAINIVALLVPFAFVGLWHRFTLMFLLWGLAVGTVLALETVVRDEWISKSKIKIPVWIVRPVVSVYSVSLVVLTLQIAMKDFAQ